MGPHKIASVGEFESRWVTLHGIAINVDLDLSPMERINPCGLVGTQMTSVARESGHPGRLAEAKERYAAVFTEVFGCRLVAASRQSEGPAAAVKAARG